MPACLPALCVLEEEIGKTVLGWRPMLCLTTVLIALPMPLVLCGAPSSLLRSVTLAANHTARVIKAGGDESEPMEGDVVWAEFPDITDQPELAVYAFDPDDNESSTWAIMRD